MTGSLWRVRGVSAGALQAEFRILAVGDSHTYGVLVEEEESYPGCLRSLLDEQEPATFAVVNKGIPGFSTGQVRGRPARTDPSRANRGSRVTPLFSPVRPQW